LVVGAGAGGGGVEEELAVGEEAMGFRGSEEDALESGEPESAHAGRQTATLARATTSDANRLSSMKAPGSSLV
jgi:hypothetical protein